MGSLKGPDNVTSTQTSEPPAYLQPYLEGAANAATNLYNQGPQQYYPGSTVVPFSQQTNQALNMQQQRAMGGSPLVDAAQNMTQQFASGGVPVAGFNSPLEGFLDGGSNPYLDATFDQAAAGVNRSLDTTLARSGRDVNANMGARQAGLNDLATNIYGGAYENDASRRLSAAGQLGNQNLQALSTQGSQQLQAAGQAIPLAREDYFDIGQLGQVGSMVEGQAGEMQQDAFNRYNFNQGAQGQALDQYIARLMGQNTGGTTTSNQPVFGNPLSSGLGGALAGGQLAGLLGAGSGWGAGIGGVLGLLSDRRTKENIERVGETDAGLPVYTYNYKGDPVQHMGVMADEAKEKFPDAVITGNDGYDRVIYGRLQ